MSKTTPEEAKALGNEYGYPVHESGDYFEFHIGRLAALIDEVRGVDAEPVPALLRFNELRGDDYESPLERLRFFCSLAMSGQDWLDVEPFLDALYMNPAPSQPAAPVELPVVMNKITPPPAYACICRASGEDKCSRWCGDSAKCIASPMLEEAKAAIKLRYTGQGAASEPESTNPYRAGSNAALYWQAGHDAAQAAIAAGRKAS